MNEMRSDQIIFLLSSLWEAGDDRGQIKRKKGSINMAIKVPKALVFRGKKWNGRSNGGGRVRISAELQYE